MRCILPVVMASAGLIVAGCGSSSSKPAYYVGTGRDAVALITWSAQHNGLAEATITDDTLSGTAPGETVTVRTVQVTARFKGGSVSFSGAGLDTLDVPAISGRMSDGKLDIKAPGAGGYLQSAVLRPSTPAVYNSDLVRLRQRASHADTTAKRTHVQQGHSGPVATDQQQVSNDVSTLQTDAGALGSDIARMGADVQRVNTDLVQLKSDAANGAGPLCGNVPVVEADAAAVDSDGSTVGNDATGVTNDIIVIQGDINLVTHDLEALARAGGSATGNPSPQMVISQVQTAVSTAISQANSYISTVNGYLQTAYSTASNLAGGSCASTG